MFYVLSDTEVALNEILVACQQSINYYQDKLNDIRDKKTASAFNTIINQRKIFSLHLEAVMLELGSLPSTPDPDRETSELIIEKVAASLSPHHDTDLIAHRIEIEKQFLALLDSTNRDELQEPHQILLKDLSLQIQNTISELSSLL